MPTARMRLASELLLLTVVAVVAFVAAGHLDIFESFAAWSRRHERLDVDELAAVSVVVMLGLALFGRRRHAEAKAETLRTAQAQESLLETSDRYQTLFTHNPHGVYSVDLKGNFVSLNQAAQAMVGSSEAELVGKSILDLLAPGHLDETVELFQRVLAGTPQSIETAVIRSTGERVDLAVKASPIVVKGKVIGAYGVADDITADLQMARDLQRTQAAVAATLDGVLIGDEDHRIVYANEASVRLHGYGTAEEMLSQPIETFLDSTDSHVFASTVMGLVSSSGRWTGQLDGSRRDGTTFVAEASISMLGDGCVVAICRDVTARVEADTRLRESDTRYRAVLEDIGSGYYETDLAGTVTYLNDAAAAIYGRTREEVLGTRFDRYAAPDAVTTLRDHAKSCLLSGVTDRAFDWHLVTPDGGRRLVSTSVAAVRDDDGEVQGFRGLVHDVTDRYETQRALTFSQERHRLLVQVTREIIWDADTASGISTLSGAIKDLFGFPYETVEVDDSWWGSRIHPDDFQASMESAVAAFKSGGNQWFHEYRLADHEGNYLSFLARGVIIRDETGWAVRFVGSLMDITQRRRQEEELRLAHRDAKDATEAKSLFLANMSHEIRTPLTSVIAGTEMALDTPLNPHQERLMGRVHRAGERLLKLVDDLLDFSKIEAGQIRIDTLPFDPAIVVHQIAVWAQEACAKKDLEFRLTMPESLSQPLLGDAHRVGQVLTNLIGNAVKFTSTGYIHLSVRAIGDDPKLTRLAFTVEDTGTGISPDHQGHIFQSFSQADPSITRHYGGSGLGLAISKDIVEFMGGSIGVSSELGRGSQFFFELPFVVAGSRAEAGRLS